MSGKTETNSPNSSQPLQSTHLFLGRRRVAGRRPAPPLPAQRFCLVCEQAGGGRKLARVEVGDGIHQRQAGLHLSVCCVGQCVCLTPHSVQTCWGGVCACVVEPGVGDRGGDLAHVGDGRGARLTVERLPDEQPVSHTLETQYLKGVRWNQASSAPGGRTAPE